MRDMTWILLAALASPAFAAVTPLPGVTPQRGTALSPFAAQVAVRVTDAAGLPVADAYVELFQSPRQMLTTSGNDSCITNFLIAYGCSTRTNAEGVARFGPFRAEWAGSFTATVSAYTG